MDIDSDMAISLNWGSILAGIEINFDMDMNLGLYNGDVDIGLDIDNR